MLLLFVVVVYHYHHHCCCCCVVINFTFIIYYLFDTAQFTRDSRFSGANASNLFLYVCRFTYKTHCPFFCGENVLVVRLGFTAVFLLRARLKGLNTIDSVPLRSRLLRSYAHKEESRKKVSLKACHSTYSVPRLGRGVVQAENTSLDPLNYYGGP